jgi:hypothetical protein
MNILYRVFFLATFALAAPFVHAMPWRISETVDEMTDEISYFVYTPGSVVRLTEYMSYRPDLVVKVTPKGTTNAGVMKYVGDIMIQIETDAFNRSKCEITTRYNREKPTTELWTTSTDRHAAFPPDWKQTISKLSAATNFTVRYVTTLGYVRTSTFDVTGLTNALKQVKSRHLKQTKK